MPSDDTNIWWCDDPEVEDRFWEKVEKSESGCWEWTGASNAPGYGRLRVNDNLLYAHRISYQFQHGPIDDAQVNHHCDNPACVRPSHLYKGDQKDNISDAIAHGDLLESRARGEENGKSVLTEPEVEEIRRLYDSGGYSERDLAGIFEVDKKTIHNVLTRKTWDHVGGSGGVESAE